MEMFCFTEARKVVNLILFSPFILLKYKVHKVKCTLLSALFCEYGQITDGHKTTTIIKT